MRLARRRVATGVHRPPVVLASDGHEYVLKLGDRDPDFPACELVAAMLAPAFEVETPAFALVEVPAGVRALLAPQGAAWADLAGDHPGGVCFGSRWIPHATPWTAALAALVSDLPSVARLFAFDVYVENGDRQPNNPNVLLAGGRLVAIDHGQALPAVQGLGHIGPYGHAQHVAWPLLAGRGGILAELADQAPSDGDIDAALDAVPAAWWRRTDRADFARRALRDRRARYRATLSGLSTP
jgi:hypothetical protein